VETTDGDTQIFSDAEGSGSQGRAFGEPADSKGGAPDEQKPPGISYDTDGHADVDLSA
jgi:hypothetical protein